jgi:phenol 2-monooxygenase
MNTGIHDAFNLAWKLSGVLKGLYSPSILDTYDLERRATANHLIQLDKDISSLISGSIPSHFNAPPDADFNDYLEQVYSANASFTVGMISYAPNDIFRTDPQPQGPSVHAGHRAPDAAVTQLGSAFPKPIRSLLRYTGQFWIIIFAGELVPTSDAVSLRDNCRTAYSAMRNWLDGSASITRNLRPAFQFLTILRGTGCLQAAETLGSSPIGTVACDLTGEAFQKYGADSENGDVVVVRPDGLVCFSCPLDGAGEQLVSYFTPLVRTSTTEQTSVHLDNLPENGGSTLGEISVDR